MILVVMELYSKRGSLLLSLYFWYFCYFQLFPSFENRTAFKNKKLKEGNLSWFHD